MLVWFSTILGQAGSGEWQLSNASNISNRNITKPQCLLPYLSFDKSKTNSVSKGALTVMLQVCLMKSVFFNSAQI